MKGEKKHQNYVCNNAKHHKFPCSFSISFIDISTLVNVFLGKFLQLDEKKPTVKMKILKIGSIYAYL